MKYLNDFESKTLNGVDPVIDERSGMPKFLTNGIYARCCVQCRKVYFCNYKPIDYMCKLCRGEYTSS